MALQHGYETSSNYGSYGRYGGGFPLSNSSMHSYGGYDTSLPSTANSSASVLGYDSSGLGYSNPTMSSFSTSALTPLDEQTIYERLADQSYKSRSEVLDHLRSSLRRSATALPYSKVELIFEGLALALTDSTWDVRQQAIQVIRDALPKLGDKLIPCMNIVMPLLVSNIGDRKTTVRKGVTQALHCYLKQPTADASLCLNALITHGFNSSDPEVVREVVAIIPVLLTQEFAEMIDVSRLLVELMRKLPQEGQPVKERLEQLALAAVEKMRSVVGDGRFVEAEGRCPRSLRRRYHALQSDGLILDDADSDVEPDPISSRLQPGVVVAPAVVPSHRNSFAGASHGPISPKNSNSIANNPNNANNAINNSNNFITNESSSYSSEPVIPIDPSYASVVAAPTSSSQPPSNHVTVESKYFGIIPGDIYAKLMDDNPRARLEGIDELKAIIMRLQSGIALHSSLSDLLRFLSDFLDDPNFKVVTTTLEIYLLLIKTAVDIRPHVGTVVDAVGRRMSDAKLLIRQGVSSVILQLMRLVTAMPVVELIAVYFRHKNSRMRQESINLAIAAMLTFPKEDFDFDFLSNAICPLLLDSKFQVRQAAMECVSIVAHLLSPGEISVLMRSLHKVEDSNPSDGEGLAAAVKVRTARHQLPRLNSDGLVEYSVALPGSASQRAMRPMPPGSDTSLILAATGGHSAARPSQSVSVFTQGADDFSGGPRTPLSGKVRLPWQSQPQFQTSHPDQAVAAFNKRSNNHAFNDIDDVVEEMGRQPGNKGAFFDNNKRNRNVDRNVDHNGYFKQYLETGKRHLAFDGSNNGRQLGAVPSHMSSSHEVLSAPRSESPVVDVWTYDDTDHIGRRVPPPKQRNSQALMRPSQLSVGQNSSSYLDSQQHDQQQQMHLSKKSIEKHPGAAVATRQLANSVAYELSAKAALDQPATNNSSQLSPPNDLNKQRGSASQRRAQRIFDRLESEDSGVVSGPSSSDNRSSMSNKSKQSNNNNSNHSPQVDDFSPKMPHRKVPALEKAFFIDLNDEASVKPPQKMKPRPVKAGGSPPRQEIDDFMYDEEPVQQPPVRRSREPKNASVMASNNGMTVMDVEAFDQSLENNNYNSYNNNNNSNNTNNFPVHMRPARPERKSLPGKVFTSSNNSTTAAAAFADADVDAAAAPLAVDHPAGSTTSSNLSSSSSSPQLSRGAVVTQPQSLRNSSSSESRAALMEEDGGMGGGNGYQKPRKQPPPIKQPVLSLGALNNRSLGSGDLLAANNDSGSFNNSMNSNDAEQFFAKTLPRPNRSRQNASVAYSQSNGFKDNNAAPEPSFPGNATYSYLAGLDNNMPGSGDSTPSNNPRLSSHGLPARDDLSRQSTHSLMAEERLRSGDERMIEKYEELKRRQKAFLRALSANFASDVVAAENASNLGSTSSGSLSAYDHNRQGTAPPQFGIDGPGSAPPKLGRRPPKLKPVAPPAGYQPQQQQQQRTPRKVSGGGPGGVAFTTFTVNAQLRAADLAYDLLPEPQPNIQRALADAATALANEDWEVKCEGVNMVRCIVKHQPSALTDSPNGNQLHTVNLTIIAEMRNLRSQVARLAIQAMREMFQQLKRAMDIDVENITKVLLGRSGDTNQFLRSDSEQALTAMVLNVSPVKALTALLQGGLGHRNVSIRRSTAQHLLEVVERMGAPKALSGAPEITGQLMPALLQFLMDGSPETRFYARKICHVLLGHQDFDKMTQKFCAPNVIANARDVIETVRQKGPGELTSIGSSQRLSDYSSVPSASSGLSTPLGSAGHLSSVGSGSPMRPRQVAPLRRLDEATLDTVRSIIAQMSSNDWRERYEGITTLVRMTESSPEVTAAQLTKIFDKFCPLLKDMNSKVNLYALQALQNMLPMISNEIASLIPLVMQHLTINLSSKSNEIQQAAAGVMHSMLAYVDPASLLQPFANQTQTANSRNKAFMIDRLSEIVDAVCDRKMKQVTLHILPLLWHLLGSVTQSGSLPGGAGNIRQSTARLAAVLHQHMGDDLIQHAGAASLPEKNYLLLQELLKGNNNAINSAQSTQQRGRGGPAIGEDLDDVVAAR